ncbi:MAG: class I SAM-dependent methyltransferase [Steroidobacteraceae bacterium]
MRSKFFVLTAGILSATLATAATPAIPDYINAAVADASRPDADVQRDENRLPAEVLAFAGVKPGDKVGELLPGRGYFSHLFCKIVGDKGHLYTIDLTRMVSRPAAATTASTAPATKGTPCANVTADTKAAAEVTWPSGLNMVWTSENYHDLYNPMFGSPDMLKFNKVIFDALLPGGVYMIEDHVAEAGSGGRDTNTLHRIDPEQVKKDVTSVGFVFEGESSVLRNANDPHTAKAQEFKGKSDKFLFKFRKPAH